MKHIDDQAINNTLSKEDLRKQFIEQTEKLGLKHTFTFDEAWEIAQEIRKYSPETKQIFFPRGSNENYLTFIKEVKPDVIALDEKFPKGVLAYAKKHNITLQGNLPPSLLIEGGIKLRKGIKNILNTFKGNKHIFNLSHGVLPQTPIENVEILVEEIKNYNED